MIGWYCRQLLAVWIVIILVGGCGGLMPEPLPPYWPTDGWRTSTPEREGLDSIQLLQMFDFIQKQQPDLHSLLIVRRGYLVTEAYFYPYRRDLKHNLYSCTKSVTSALVGIAIREGLIEGVDQPVFDFLPKPNVAHRDSRKQAITVEHLLTMTSGLDWEEWTAPYYSPRNSATRMLRRQDWVPYVLGSPLVEAPGSRFNYNSGGSHLLSAILQKSAKMSTLSFAQAHLFQPLGISDVSWPTDPQGITTGHSDLELTPRDMAKFGYLYLQGGMWDGQQIVPADWVKASVKKHVGTNYLDWGYGYQWWVQPGMYAAMGWGGQYIVVIPDQELVVVFTSGLNNDSIFPEQLIEDFIIPAVKSPEPLPENPGAMAELKAKIRAAGQPGSKSVPPLPDIAQNLSNKTYTMKFNALGWRSFSLSFGEKETLLNVSTREGRFKFPIGMENVFRMTEVERYGPLQWSGSLALRGFWQDDKTFVVYEHVLGQADSLEYRYTFIEDRVSIRWREFVEDGSLYLSGELQK